MRDLSFRKGCMGSRRIPWDQQSTLGVPVRKSKRVVLGEGYPGWEYPSKKASTQRLADLFWLDGVRLKIPVEFGESAPPRIRLIAEVLPAKRRGK